MKVYFLKPDAGPLLKTRLTELFQNKEDLHIAVAYFNSKYFSDLILQRAENKQKTFLILNTADLVRPENSTESKIVISEALINILQNGYESNYIFCKCLGIRTSGNYQNMHHKFIFNKNTVIVGSLNLTDAALHRNYESVIEINNPSIIRNFYTEYENLWIMASEIFSRKSGEVRSIMCPNCQVSDGVDFESFGPVCYMCGYKFIVK